MKPLEKETEQTLDKENVAGQVIDAILLGMRAIRRQMRKARPGEITVPQFRTLAYLKHNEGASLSELADHIGLVLPSMSKTVDWLVKRGLVSRKSSVTDRRKIVLRLTPKGETIYLSARKSTEDYIARKLASLTPEENASLIEAIKSLNRIFDPESDN